MSDGEGGWSADVPIQTGPDEYIVVCRGPGGARRVVWGTAPYEVAERADRECDEHNERESSPAWLPKGWTLEMYYQDEAWLPYNIRVVTDKGYAYRERDITAKGAYQQMRRTLVREFPHLFPEEAT